MNHVAAVKLLLSVPSINLNRPTQNGKTPLAIASKYNLVDIVKLILCHPKFEWAVGNRRNALVHSTLDGNPSTIKLLVTIGASKEHFNINQREVFGMSALMECATTGSGRCMEILLEHPDIDPNLEEKERTALTYGPYSFRTLFGADVDGVFRRKSRFVDCAFLGYF